MGIDDIKHKCSCIIDNKKNIEEESFAKTLLVSLEKANRRMFFFCILISLLCGYMVYERMQYDYSSYTVTQELDENGNISYIGENGDIVVDGETSGSN